MGMSAVQYKIMPESLDSNLDKIKDEAKEKIEKLGGTFGNSEKQPIAFGLNSLLISFAYPESSEVEEVEKEIISIGGVSSVELIDYRRAVG